MHMVYVKVVTEKRGEMEAIFKLTAKQAVAYKKLTDSTSTEIGYGGGAGGGKSFIGCFWILSQALAYPETAWLIGRRELTNLKKTTLLSFFKVLQVMDIDPNTIFTLNSQTNIIQFNNGSKIFLMDMSYQPSDPLYTRFGGLELTGAFVDESNENELQSIEIIKTRLGRGKNEEYNIVPKLLETFNPSKNHVYHRYYRPFKDNKLPEHRVFITALATDNIYLDPSYIEQLKNADRITKERLLYGNFEYDDDPSKLFEYDKIIDIFTNEYHHTPKEQKYISCDVARFGLDKTVIFVWQGLLIVDVKVIPKSDLKVVVNIINELSKRHGIPNSNIIIDEDGVGGGVVDFLSNVKGFVNNSSPIETNSSKKFHNYRNLKTQCYFKLAEYINQGKICYSNAPEELKDMIIQDLEQIAQRNIDRDGKIELVPKEEVKEKLGRSTDYGDAMSMRMWFELKGKWKPYIA